MILARRLPASRPGHGRAARYVSGKIPVTAKSNYKPDSHKSNTAGTTSGDVASGINKAQTEQEKIAAMFAAAGDQWEQQQQQMAQ